MARVDTPQPTADRITIRPPGVDDAAGVWALVRDSGVLDLNSPYAYLLAFRHHAETSVVAVEDGRVVGFVLAYRPPQAPATLFVWQVGVAASQRRQGLGRRLLLAALARPACRDVRALEATVTPSNRASLALFRGVAARLGAGFAVSPCFTESHFPAGAGHEAEHLVRIDPIRETLEVNQ